MIYLLFLVSLNFSDDSMYSIDDFNSTPSLQTDGRAIKRRRVLPPEQRKRATIRSCRRCKASDCPGSQDITKCKVPCKTPCKTCGQFEGCKGVDGGRNCTYNQGNWDFACNFLYIKSVHMITMNIILSWNYWAFLQNCFFWVSFFFFLFLSFSFLSSFLFLEYPTYWSVNWNTFALALVLILPLQQLFRYVRMTLCYRKTSRN